MNVEPKPHWKEERWSLTSRLRLLYPVGPRLANGEPEMGWRSMTPLNPELGHPQIQYEAAHRIEELEALLKEAAELFRSYEAHHRAKASEAGRPEKAERNAEIASRIEEALS